MKADNWKKISEILPDCLEIEVSERKNFLDKLSLNAETRSELENFLTLENEAEDFMSATADGVANDFFSNNDSDESRTIGQKIGIYKITGEIGFGGMGAVYLAERSDGEFSQKVAIKMLRREFNVEKIRQTFRREKEILAKLAHPNVARLLDAGRCDDGIPFLVMEYVEGTPVDKYCERENLSLKERLKLFNRICDAVSFAHRNLIVHRDLKPSNILVTEKGEPKLLDFGISKLLDAENAEEKSSVTILGAMTPEYASPEQIRGETVTTATDIYSLGVVLYKILTGAFPYNFKGKTNGELLKSITEDKPTAPSAVSNLELNIADKDQKTQLKGDVDNIILKAIAKEPERRYQTVEQFSADIWRFIDGLPVAARPSTYAYRASKFFLRNRLSVAAAALIFFSLIGGIAVALWQAKEANAQANHALDAQRQAEQQFALAKSEEEKSKEISRFMFKVFSYANPAWYAEGAKYGGQARVLDALDDLSGRIETEFEEKDIQAELHHQFGEVYARVLSYNTEPARRAEMKEKFNFHICRALELRREFYGDWHELVAKDMYYGTGCIARTKAETAAVWNKTIEIFRGTNPNNLNLPYLLTDYANQLVIPEEAADHDIFFQAVSPPTVENKYQIAERYYREALPIYRQHYKPDNLAIFIAECRLSYVLAAQEKWTDFDEHFAVCKQGEPEMRKFYSTAETAQPKPLDLVEKVLAEKNR